ncbi:MAG: preprotein translocase subunit SecG [Bacteroidetes bacterium]|jgi:preprotein translocase subunit SecG|nr:preprotein translocase subunit SecG [Bacteroidota bacterium]MDA0930601.1 preprotein translocase subunit SecG [Bacteroidota bacterium]
MDIIMTVVILLVAVLLILVILIQNSKGGGISSNIGVSNQLFGARKETELIEKRTWQLMGLLAVLCISSGFFFSYEVKTDVPQARKPLTTLDNQMPAMPAPESPSVPAAQPE